MALSGPPLPKKVNTPHAIAPYLLLNRLITMILGKLGAIYFVQLFCSETDHMHFTSF